MHTIRKQVSLGGSQLNVFWAANCVPATLEAFADARRQLSKGSLYHIIKQCARHPAEGVGNRWNNLICRTVRNNDKVGL